MIVSPLTAGLALLWTIAAHWPSAERLRRSAEQGDVGGDDGLRTLRVCCRWTLVRVALWGVGAIVILNG